jgi:hypothetical protein
MDDGVILKHKSRLQARISATICILVDVYSRTIKNRGIWSRQKRVDEIVLYCIVLLYSNCCL